VIRRARGGGSGGEILCWEGWGAINITVEDGHSATVQYRLVLCEPVASGSPWQAACGSGSWKQGDRQAAAAAAAWSAARLAQLRVRRQAHEYATTMATVINELGFPNAECSVAKLFPTPMMPTRSS
jgi:hypothetical protein